MKNKRGGNKRGESEEPSDIPAKISSRMQPRMGGSRIRERGAGSAMSPNGHGMGKRSGMAGSGMESESVSRMGPAIGGSGMGSGMGGGGMAGGMGGSGIGGGGMGKAEEVEPPNRRRCGTMEVHRRLLSESPSYALARDRIENLTLELVRDRRLEARAPGVVRIPVVVHLVWNTPGQNISDTQIHSQIDVINRDFRRLNPDVSQVPSIWQGIVGDAFIEFELATEDPNGNPTSGITRTQTSETSFGGDDGVKASATGGADPWPSDRYLNMWVCQLGGGLLGYAQFPGGPPETDGVVITHTGFGTTGTAAAPFDLGRTATHEIGHWLNLFHIFGDDGTGCTGSDLVDDTPNQAGPNFGTPTFPHVSCNNGPNGDMFMNYMDYTDDVGMFMFTAGQVARIRACIEGPRSSFIDGAVSATIPAAGPVVAWGQDRLDAFALGTDSGVYHKWWDGSAWGPSVTDWESLGGICITPPRAVAWGSDRLDVFVLGTDSQLYHKWWDGSAWGPSISGWEGLGGICISPPEPVAWGPDRLDLFVLGTDSQLYHKWWDGSAWGPSVTGWEGLGGICITPPRALAWGSDRLDVFVLGTDSQLYHKWWGGSSWGPSVTGWEGLGGICITRPEAVAWGPDRLDLFVLGTDSQLYHKWWDGSTWGPSVTGWEGLGGISISPPRVVAWGPNRLDVFVLGTDSALYHKWWDGSAWGPSVTGWEGLGGTCISPPEVVAWGPDRLDLFVVGTDSRLYHKWWDGTAWGPSVTGWEPLGGTIIDFRPSAGVQPAAARSTRTPIPARTARRAFARHE